MRQFRGPRCSAAKRILPPTRSSSNCFSAQRRLGNCRRILPYTREVMRGAHLMPLIRTALCLALVLLTACRSSSQGARPTSSSRPSVSAPPAPGAVATPQLPPDLTMLSAVGKTRALAPGYVPPDLTLIPPEFVSSLEPQKLRKP